MKLRVLFHNVGHGQAIHCFLPSGHVVVIDLGCSAQFSPLGWLHKSHKTIDLLIVTHPHGDHIDEIEKLDALGFKVRQFWRPRWLTADVVRDANQSDYKEKVDAYLAKSESYNHEIPVDQLVTNPTVSGGVTIDVCASSACGTSNINNHSGVVVFRYLNTKIIVPGDNEPPSWTELLKNPYFVSAAKAPDIFMASHHGRESGYHADLFDESSGIAKPSLCVISDGRVKDTDAAARYSYHAKGWKVHRRAGGEGGDRSCVTTRSDGYIDVEIGKQTSGNTYVSVTAD